MVVVRLASERGCCFQPEELSYLQEAFLRICARRGIDRYSGEAELIAANLVDFYQIGLRDEDLLRAFAGMNVPHAGVDRTHAGANSAHTRAGRTRPYRQATRT